MVEDLSEVLGVMAVWDGAGATEYGLCYADPRLPALGMRCMLPPHLAGEAAADLGATLVDAAEYEAHRIALGVPRGGLDFNYNDAFPHEADMDQLGGIDFDKGCYVGQEVVSRVEHRGTARKRVVPVTFDGFRARGRRAGDGGRQDRSARHGLVRAAAAGSRCCVSTASAMRSPPARRSMAGGIAIATASSRPGRVRLAGRAKAAENERALLHPDGLHRCPWPKQDPFYVAYHDDEWGVPEYDDRALYEKLVLDGFQAGLSWITILRKRENFRRAFDGFEPEKIARYTPRKKSSG